MLLNLPASSRNPTRCFGSCLGDLVLVERDTDLANGKLDYIDRGTQNAPVVRFKSRHANGSGTLAWVKVGWFPGKDSTKMPTTAVEIGAIFVAFRSIVV